MSSYILLPLISFLVMFAQDILGVWLVRAESQGRSGAAGNWDMLNDACRMIWLYCGGDAIFVNKNFLLAGLVVGFTLLADKIGTYTGSELGKYIDAKREGTPWQPNRSLRSFLS